MKIKIENAEIEVDDSLGKQICSLIKDSVKEPYKFIDWNDIINSEIDKSRIQVGTQIKVQSDAYSPSIIFDVIDINSNTLTLVSHYIVTELSFDEAEPNNLDYFIRHKGSNNYFDSNIRQWLNREESVFMPTTIEDVCSASMRWMPFFSTKLLISFLNAATNAANGDKFTLLTIKDLEKYSYFQKKERLEKTDTNGVSKSWWLRSPYITNNHSQVYLVNSIGQVCHGDACEFAGIVPACKIKI